MGEIVLEYAIYHSPLAFVRKLLDLGADANYGDHAGFPSLIATLSADRPDRRELLKLLLDYGADVSQRGVNDDTALHDAAATDNVPAIESLLAHGADPSARTNVDDCATPLEEAERGQHRDAVAALRRHAAK